MNPAQVLVPIAFFFSVAAIAILRGPLGRALAERIAGRSSDAGATARVDDVLAEVDELNHRLAQMEERLDFTERMLAQQQLRGLERPPGRD